MVSVHSPISSSSLSKPLVIVPSAPITFGITVTFKFHSLCSSLTKSKYLSLFFFFFFFSFSLIFTLCSAEIAKSTIWQVLFFSLTITRSGLLAGIMWSVHLFLQGEFWFVHILSGNKAKFQFLTLFVEDYFPHLVVSFFYASLLHSLIM